MLPDFIELKRTVQNRLRGQSRTALSEQSMVGFANEIPFYEGSQTMVHRPDGSKEKMILQPYEVGFEVDHQELEARGFEVIGEGLRSMHEDMKEKFESQMFETVMKTTEETGNVIDAGGQPFTAELWLEALETLEFSFDPDGEWNRPQLVVHPAKQDRVVRELQRLEEEPELKQELDELVTRKRKEWRERESRRKLVD